jgi:catechol 2,3-dioxygenase-like lactoylglutathione lyase family enzyme
MIHGIRVFALPVDDLDRARALFTAALGVEPYADTPYYVGFRVGDLEIGLDERAPAAGRAGRASAGPPAAEDRHGDHLPCDGPRQETERRPDERPPTGAREEHEEQARHDAQRQCPV